MTESSSNIRVVGDEGDAHLEPFLDLKRRVEITRDARFQANLRLEPAFPK